MPCYTFRSANTPQGFLHAADLEYRVLASLEDASNDGIDVRYEWVTAEIGSDDRGDYVRLQVIWPPDMPAYSARKYIDGLHVDIEG